MPITELRSKRLKGQSGVIDPYKYDVPLDLRIQIANIWDDAIGYPALDRQIYGNPVKSAYQQIVEMLRRGYGLLRLDNAQFVDPKDNSRAYEELRTFFFDVGGVGDRVNPDDKATDVIELTFRVIDSYTRSRDYLLRNNYDQIADTAIEELNTRFKEHAVGYASSDHTLIRIDSEFVHTEVVKPALVVLRRPGYESAQEEFLEAHKHYREGRNSEALVECNKAFESVMKIICTKRGWTFNPSKDTASTLVKICSNHGLIPPFWEAHFLATPTARNKLGGHGAGAAPPHSPSDELTAHVLHITAASIVYLTEAERKLP